MQAIQSHLKSTSGISPSIEWLTACTAHLRLNIHSANNAAGREEIWYQILHSNLRDVCRDQMGGEHCEASKILREGIANSVKDGKATLLKEGFRLLVQLEEVVDVSLNAEGQLGGDGNANNSNGNSNNYNNNQGRNMKSRMLKMALSDGYTTNSNSPIIAMETTPLPRLSSKTPSGTKLLLHSSLLIRHGMLQLNPSNCLVVGGRIGEWEEIARQKREKEGRARGMGVDATVKALIWCADDGDEDEVDEGEGESRDVTTPRQPPPSRIAPPPPVNAVTPAMTPRSSTPNSYSGNNSYSNPATNSQNQNRNPNSSTHSGSSSKPNPYQRNSSDSNGFATQNSTNNPYQRNSNDANGFSNQSSSNNPYRKNANGSGNQNTTPQNNASQNPYQRNFNDANGIGTQNSTMPKNSSQSHNQRTNNPYRRISNESNGLGTQNSAIKSNFTQNPYQQNSSTQSKSSVIPNNGFGSAQSSIQRLQPSQQGSTANPYASLRPSLSTITQSSSITATPASNDKKRSEVDLTASPRHKTSPATNTPSPLSPTINTGSENFSFSELKAHLIKLSQNRELYSLNYGKTYEVPCKLRSDGVEKRVFNIVKIDKKKSRKGGKKHEFLFVCSFLGPKASDGSISCRVDSSLMEPFFGGHTPSEIRKLQREEKDRANKLVNSSSTQFLHEFSCLAMVHLKLLLSPEEFFGKISSTDASTGWMEDLNNPVLVVVERKNI